MRKRCDVCMPTRPHGERVRPLSFLTLISPACRVMSADPSFAAFGRRLCRPSAPLSLRRWSQTTLFPQKRPDTLAHSFIPPLGVESVLSVPTGPGARHGREGARADRHLRDPLLSLGRLRHRTRRRRPDHRRSNTMGSFPLFSSLLPRSRGDVPSSLDPTLAATEETERPRRVASERGDGGFARYRWRGDSLSLFLFEGAGGAGAGVCVPSRWHSVAAANKGPNPKAGGLEYVYACTHCTKGCR